MVSAMSALDNIVGNLWQQRQESSGSSVGNQSPRNGEDLSDAEGEHENNGHHANEVSIQHQDSLSEEGFNGQVRVHDSSHLMKDDINGSKEEKEFDPRSLPANLPPLPALEAFNKHLANSQSLLASLGGHGRVPFPTMPPGFQPPHSTLSPLSGSLPNLPNLAPPRPPSQPSTPSSQQSSSPNKQSFSSQQNWSFEEQFKQLYEIDDNPKRKEFLDELFTMMQKRGSPINRLPIMAKQVLDLYELYNLVCARGGLVEVVNKKLWQEVIKGLGLPSSITSAAFTLRTQYTKYLYPYECIKRNFSNPNELAAAIEGNKREGHRGGHGAYQQMAMAGLHPSQMSRLQPSQISPLPLVTGPFNHRNNSTSHGSPTPPTSRSPAAGNGMGPNHDPHSSLEQTRLALLKMFGAAPPMSLPNLPQLPGLPPDMFQHVQQEQDKALNLHLQRQRAVEAVAREHAKDDRLKLIGNESENEAIDEDDAKNSNEDHPGSIHNENSVSPPPSIPAMSTPPIMPQSATLPIALPGSGGKRRHRSHDSDEVEDVSSAKKHLSNRPLGLPSANIKIENRSNGDSSSIVVSIEINGATYQGVLFAEPGKHRTPTS